MSVSTIDEREASLGEAVRQLRLERLLTQAQLSELANVSLSALKNLENGRGSHTSTLIRVVHALGRDEWLAALAPEMTFNPLDLLERRSTNRRRPVRRVRRSTSK
jgi:transcriptional regulator with XRE-family HTH domain